MRAKFLLLSLCFSGTLVAPAQVLARPGWAGSGVAPESWWRRAVFYRLDPLQFQDSNGDGKGDLQGVRDRLDYLQATGADALLLDGTTLTGDDTANDLEDLIRDASSRHLRVLLTVPAHADSDAALTQHTLLGIVHNWLSNGAAGVYLPANVVAQPSTLIPAIRAMLRSFPGDRVLLAAAATGSPVPAPSANNSTGPLLLSSYPFALAGSNPTPIRTTLSDATLPPDPLIEVSLDPPTGSPLDAVVAALLFASRGASILNAGDEIGLDLDPAAKSAGASTPLPVMQWTPSNLTRAAAPEAVPKPAGSETIYGPYHPYQPLVHGVAATLPAPVRVTPDPNIPPDPPAPDTLPGFTAGSLPVSPVEGKRINVVTEDRDPGSVLNFYRQLIGLHHDNPTLRNGAQFVLNHDAEGALVWLRRAPGNSRNPATIVVAANLTDHPVTLNLKGDLQSNHLPGGVLREVASSTSQFITGATTASLTLPAHAVYLGEVLPGSSFGPAPYRHRPLHRVSR